MSMDSKNAKMFTTKDAAEILGISEGTVRAHCAAGSFPVKRNGIPGTKFVFYTFGQRGLDWLRENIVPRNRQKQSAS